MPAIEYLTEFLFLLDYLELAYKKCKVSYTGTGCAQHMVYVTLTSMAMYYEEFLFADTPRATTVIHADYAFWGEEVTYNSSPLTKYPIAHFFYDNQTHLKSI